MFNVFIIAEETEQTKKLGSDLGEYGFICSFCSDRDEAVTEVTGKSVDLVLVAITNSPVSSGIEHLMKRINAVSHLPAIALISQDMLDRLDSTMIIDDFVVEPWNAIEVAARAKRVLWRTKNIDSEELIKYGDLVIDLYKYEVYLGGKLIALTFKEYELLKFLASNRGRVFTRETLLNKVWGYDYYGGDRTVDVHIRRLRSKIEDATHSYIDTVRNIGYKFR